MTTTTSTSTTRILLETSDGELEISTDNHFEHSTNVEEVELGVIITSQALAEDETLNNATEYPTSNYESAESNDEALLVEENMQYVHVYKT